MDLFHESINAVSFALITPTWQGLGILGAIIVIRTILSYFLTKDLKKI